MKTAWIVLSLVYGISWGILLLIYLQSELSTKKNEAESFATNKEQEPWYFYALLIIFAPIIVLCIPFISISDAIKKRKSEKWQKEKDIMKKKLEEEQDRAFQNYQEGTQIPLEDDFIDKGQFLNYIVNEEDYQRIMEGMSEIHLPNGYSLEVKFAEEKGMGDRSTLLAKAPSRETCDFFDTITVDNTPTGAIEVYLLYEIWHYLPLFWHANYKHRTYIYSFDDLKYVHTVNKKDQDYVIERIKDCEVTPILVRNKDRYYISCCYWSDFGGFNRELVEIEIKDNKVAKIFEVNETTLFKYKCGILF